MSGTGEHKIGIYCRSCNGKIILTHSHTQICTNTLTGKLTHTGITAPQPNSPAHAKLCGGCVWQFAAAAFYKRHCLWLAYLNRACVSQQLPRACDKQWSPHRAHPRYCTRIYVYFGRARTHTYTDERACRANICPRKYPILNNKNGVLMCEPVHTRAGVCCR